MDHDLAERAERRGGVDQRLARIEERQNEHDGRLTDIEKDVQQAIGALKVVSVLLGASAFGYILNLIGII
jgi:hypothetical protein